MPTLAAGSSSSASRVQGRAAVFLYGFAKRERENIEADELLTLREIGAAWLAADPRSITQAIKEGALQEVIDDEKEAT